MKSHIQIPKSILKMFAKDGELCSLNIKTKEINTKETVNINAKADYYTTEMEHLLDKIYEQPFGRIKTKVSNFTNSDDDLIISDDEIECIRNYIYFSILRSNYIAKEVQDSLVTAELIPYNRNHEDAIRYGIQYKDNNSIKDNLRKMTITLMVNRTSLRYVLPNNCFYETKILGFKTFAIPINPEVVIIMGLTTKLQKFINHYLIVSKENDIELMNLEALKCEINWEGQYIISRSQKELENLKQFLGN